MAEPQTQIANVARAMLDGSLNYLQGAEMLVGLREDAGVYANFFGRPVLTGKLTHALAKHNQSPVLTAAVLRKPNGEGFTIVFNKVEDMATQDTIEAATALNQAIEKCIHLAPEQYQWVYRRFAKPPKGFRDIYQTESAGE